MSTIRKILEEVRGNTFDLKVGEICYEVTKTDDTYFDVFNDTSDRVLGSIRQDVSEAELRQILTYVEIAYQRGRQEGEERLARRTLDALGLRENHDGYIVVRKAA